MEWVKVDVRRLYRYSAQKWNDALLESGSVRIGTLHDYRREEHKPGIADALEGLKQVHHKVVDYDSKDEIPGSPSINARALARGMIRASSPVPGGPIPTFQLEGVQLIWNVSDPNVYIHCTSFRLSKAVMAQFQGADSCVEIFDIKGFYRALTAELNKKVPIKHTSLTVLRYQNRIEPFNGEDMGYPAWSVKDQEFAGQYEVRALWVPRNSGPIEPVFLTVPDLAKFCRPIDVK